MMLTPSGVSTLHPLHVLAGAAVAAAMLVRRDISPSCVSCVGAFHACTAIVSVSFALLSLTPVMKGG